MKDNKMTKEEQILFNFDHLLNSTPKHEIESLIGEIKSENIKAPSIEEYFDCFESNYTTLMGQDDIHNALFKKLISSFGTNNYINTLFDANDFERTLNDVGMVTYTSVKIDGLEYPYPHWGKGYLAQWISDMQGQNKTPDNNSGVFLVLTPCHQKLN